MRNIITSCVNKALAGVAADDEAVDALLDAPLCEMTAAADAVKRAFFGDDVSFCAITNARSGACGEDCAFCAQSAHADTGAPTYPFRAVADILADAQEMKRAGVERFSVVTSGRSAGGDEFASIVEAVRGITAMGLKADVSAGILDATRLRALKAAGAVSYHHNLETARSFFPAVCTTHDYDDDVAVVKHALQAGLSVCSGGIFGLGETWEHRIELARELSSLGVDSVPINFLTPVAGTPMAHRPVMQPDEALRIVALYRFLLPAAHVRVCGGRMAVFGDTDPLAVIRAGASGVMTGNYLTTAGYDARDDVSGVHGLRE